MKSIFEYIRQNIANVTYKRVLAAAAKHPGYSVFEYQHGINSVASQEYRKRHPPEEPKLRIFCYRDTLTGDKYAYKGINLYFAEKSIYNFMVAVREHFAEQFERYFGNMDYDRSDRSECSAEDMDNKPDEIMERDFIFDIGNLKSAQLQYWGHWQKDHFVELNIFDDFDIGKLERILMRR